MDDVVSPLEATWSRSVYHLYVIRVKQRDALMRFLNNRDIATGLHYPIPLHLQRAYQHLGYRKGDFPTAEKVAEEILSLPMYPELTEEKMDCIICAIPEFLSKINA
jgi:dTDP-4-amino-4,6-dideoxygalactose transaminase